MDKRKRFGMFLGIILVLALSVLGGIALFKNKQKVTMPTTDKPLVIPTLSEARASNAPMSPIAAGLGDLSIANDKLVSKDYSGAIALAKSVAANSSLKPSVRVQAMTFCIKSAKDNNDLATAKDCETQARKLIDESTTVSKEESSYLIFLVRLALGEVKQSDFGGTSAGR